MRMWRLQPNGIGIEATHRYLASSLSKPSGGGCRRFRIERGPHGLNLQLQADFKSRSRLEAMDYLTIGELATRSGVATSALRFYETKGLISSERTDGNQRRYPRATLRRVALIRAGQEVGLTLGEVGAALATLPHDVVPTKTDWQRLSSSWQSRLDQQIAELQALRNELTDCIGCGCLSLKSCSIFNPSDAIASRGTGARYLLGDERISRS